MIRVPSACHPDVLISTAAFVVALFLCACATTSADEQGPGSEDPNDGQRNGSDTFPCGDTECEQVSEYCEEVRDFDGTLLSTTCENFPEECPQPLANSCDSDEALFDCVLEGSSADWSYECLAGGSREFRSATFLEPPVERCLADQGEALVPETGVSSRHFTVSEVVGGGPSEYYVVLDPYALGLLQQALEDAGPGFEQDALDVSTLIQVIDVVGTDCDADDRVAVVVNISPDNLAMFVEESRLFEEWLIVFVEAAESAIDTVAERIRNYFYQELFEFLLGELLPG